MNYRPYKDQGTEQLVDLLGSGNADALEEIYRQYYNRLMQYGLQTVRIGGKNIVHDAIQEFFMWLAKNYQKVNRIEDFENYAFYSIRQNVKNKSLQKSKEQTSLLMYIDKTGRLEEGNIPSSEDIIVKNEECSQRRSFIRMELNKLPNFLKEVIHLRYFEYKKYPEIANIMNISEQVARNYVSRGIKRLRSSIKGKVQS